MIETIVVIIGIYFLIGFFVMDSFFSNKYAYRSANMSFKSKTNRDFNTFDYFVLVIITSYMWPKIAYLNFICKKYNIDKNEMLKNGLEMQKKDFENTNNKPTQKD